MGSRTRSKTNVANTYQYALLDWSVGGTDVNEGPYLTSYDYEYMTDVVVPNYKKLIRSGATIVNPLTYQRTVRTSMGTGGSSFTATNSGGTVVSAWSRSGPLTGAVLSQFRPLSGDDKSSSARRSAVLSAISGVDSTPLATGEDLLELGETIKFLKAPLKSILRELKKRKVTSLIDVPTSAWLTYRFALAPFVRSVHDILNELSQPTAKPADIRVSHGRSTYGTRLTDRYELNLGGGFYRTLGKSFSVEGSVHATVRYRVKDPSYDFRWRYGLRGKDLPEAFWAVMPLSFMIDRIFDVSSMIAAARVLADPSVEILGSSVTDRRSVEHTYQLISQRTTNQYQSYSGTGEVVKDSTFTMTRQPFQPSLSDIIPAFKPAGLVSDLTKVADLAALLRAFTKR